LFRKAKEQRFEELERFENVRVVTGHELEPVLKSVGDRRCIQLINRNLSGTHAALYAVGEIDDALPGQFAYESKGFEETVIRGGRKDPFFDT